MESSGKMFHFFPISIVFVIAGAYGSLDESPFLNPSGQIIKKSGEDLLLTCSGSYPLEWDSDPKVNKNDPRIEIRSEKKPSGLYQSMLSLTNLTYMDRITFICLYESSELGESVDLFIDDPKHLIPSSSELEVFHMFSGIKNVIPHCKPTHPDVEIRLSKEDDGQDVLKSLTWSYSPSIGFTVNPTVQHDGGYYICEAKRGEVTNILRLISFVTMSPGNLRHPVINSTLAQAIPVGGTFILDCLVESDRQTYWSVNWTQPEDIINSNRAKTELRNLSPKTHKKFSMKLTVSNATIEDGMKDYVCSVLVSGVNYSVNDTVSIFEPGQEYLEVNASNEGNITSNASEKEDAIWIIHVFGFPRPDTFHWKNHKGVELTTTRANSRYSLKYQVDKNQVVLTIHGVSIQDSGRYYFTAENRNESRTLNLFLNVRDIPIVSLKTKGMFFRVHKTYKFSCRAAGFPYPEINWYFKHCDSESTHESKCGSFSSIQSTEETRHRDLSDVPPNSIQEIDFYIQGSGYLLCLASNALGSSEERKLIVGVDFPESGNKGYGIHGSNGSEAILEPIQNGTAVYLCSASKANFSKEIKWYYKNMEDGSEISEENFASKFKGVEFEEKMTEWSFQKEFRINRIDTNFNGQYRCEVESLIEEKTLSDSIDLSVRPLALPVIVSERLNSSKITTGSTWNAGKLYCNATGVPEPTISWLKDNELIKSIPKLRDEIIIGPNFIDFKGLSSEYNGRYICKASNLVGSVEKYVDIEVKKEAHWELIICLIGLVLVLLCVSAIAAYQYYRDQKMKRWLKKLHLQDFEKGDIEKINPEEGVESQVNLLPYDKKFEVPRDRLKLGIRIGSGAFGQVVQAVAFGINGEKMTTVAVKMVKPNSDESHFKALMSELKIMIHLGQHVNVVNLLGACTKQLVKKRELLVIVEYCKYGSLLSYLHRHREDFIDQLDRQFDIVNPDICFPLEPQSKSPIQRLTYAALTFTDSGVDGSRQTANGYHTMQELPLVGPNDHRPNSGDYALSTHMESMCTDMSYISNTPTTVGTDGRKMSSTSAWNGHYRGLYQYREVRPITTTDLLCWCFQIARGMAYLASRNVLHGDLAARNVLLAEDNVVKICDFGLAREMYEEKYRKKTEVPLPIKWMALESIYYRVFSTQSDVWSFGVVMWELFTLGKNPYPGMEPDEQFYTSLSQGYRMEKPNYAPSSIYDLMCACWDKEPSARPSFSAISDSIGGLMHDGLRNHYVDLNVPYLDFNQQRMDGHEDYLCKMSGPDFSSVSKRPTPDRSYANLTAERQSTSDYLVPKSFSANNTLMPPPLTHGNYQNLDREGAEPSLHRLANNTGYVFMNRREESPPDIVSPRLSSLDEEPMPKFKHDSVSIIDENGDSVNEDYLLPSSPRSIKIQGVSNMNYVPNNSFTPANLLNSIGQAPAKISDDEKSNHDQGKRHKNDSGVSSVDSTYETNLKKTPPPNGNMWNGGDFIDNSLENKTKHVQPPSLPTLANTATH